MTAKQRGMIMFQYFSDRVDAGKRLVSALAGTVKSDSVVLAIPRGGVVVGFQIASAFNLILDVIVPRKIGAPGNPEFAIGAVTQDGSIVLDEKILRYLNISDDYIDAEAKVQKKEIERRLEEYREGRSPAELKGHDVILVDDGIATGSTMKAALMSIRKSEAKSITVAVPVGPEDTIQALEKKADRVVCLYTPQHFNAIGEFYEDFNQTSDEEVKELLTVNRQKLTQKVTSDA
jgi:putative phosphoribosyl transferase